MLLNASALPSSLQEGYKWTLRLLAGLDPQRLGNSLGKDFHYLKKEDQIMFLNHHWLHQTAELVVNSIFGFFSRSTVFHGLVLSKALASKIAMSAQCHCWPTHFWAVLDQLWKQLYNVDACDMPGPLQSSLPIFLKISCGRKISKC